MQDGLIVHVCSLRKKGNTSCDGIYLNPRLHQLRVLKHMEEMSKTNKEEYKKSVPREQHIDGLSSKVCLSLEDRVKFCRYISLYVLYTELSSTVKVCHNILAAFT